LTVPSRGSYDRYDRIRDLADRSCGTGRERAGVHGVNASPRAGEIAKFEAAVAAAETRKRKHLWK